MPNRIETSERLIEVSDGTGTLNKRSVREMCDDLEEQVKRCDALLAQMKIPSGRHANSGKGSSDAPTYSSSPTSIASQVDSNHRQGRRRPRGDNGLDR